MMDPNPAFDAQLQYEVEKAAQDLLRSVRTRGGDKQQAKVEVIVHVAGRKYSSLKKSPSLEGDTLVTGHEEQVRGIRL